jgi:prevent-host-death family protein
MHFWLDRACQDGYKRQMKTATVTEAKNRLSALIDQVKAGETVTITDRGTPVARLEPVVSSGGQEGRLARLARAGTVRVPQRADARLALTSQEPPPAASSSVVAALLDERRFGR